MSVMVAVRILICWLVVAVGWIEVGSYDRKAEVVTIVFSINPKQNTGMTIVLGNKLLGITFAYLDLALAWLGVPNHHLVLLIPDHVGRQRVGDTRLNDQFLDVILRQWFRVTPIAILLVVKHSEFIVDHNALGSFNG